MKNIHLLLIFLFTLSCALPLAAQRSSKAEQARQLLQQSKTTAGRAAASDLDNMVVASETYSKMSGVTHVYFQQTVNGIPVHNAILNAHVTTGC